LQGFFAFSTKEIFMSHEIETMAYARDTPWHGLGNHLTPNQPVETWVKEAGMDWSIGESEVLYNVTAEGMHLRPYSDAKVLYRSDTLNPLSVVSKRYQTVQPYEVLHFYKDLVSAGGFELETAGVLKGGKKLWALARTGQHALVKGSDNVKAYLLLATSCDGTLATTAQFTSVRVVCNNTLQMATADCTGAVKVPHSTKFDPKAVQESLGIGLSAWDKFMGNIRQLANRTVSALEATQYFSDVLDEQVLDLGGAPTSKAMQQVTHLYSGTGIGSLMPSARGTAWGLVNSVTEYVDRHRRARSPDFRLDSAWFGQGAQIKQQALNRALEMVA
jgi:phage/plasmid-like protein (TIGR03299 family)